jgi:hypothetical protein
MRVLARFAMVVALMSCGSKTTPGAGSASGSSGSAQQPEHGSAGSAAVVTGSATGSDTAGSAVAGSGSASAGSAAALDPKFESIPPEERRTCRIYARCKVEGLRDDDPQAEAKKPSFENACLTVWVTLSAADKKKIASCADKVGQCLGPPDCFDSMKL